MSIPTAHLQNNLVSTNFALAQLQASVDSQNAANASAFQALQAALAGVGNLTLTTIETIAYGSGSAVANEVLISDITGFSPPGPVQALLLQIDMGVSVGSGGSFQLCIDGSSWFNAVSVPSFPTGSSGIVSGTCLLPCTYSFFYQSTGLTNPWTLRLVGYLA